MIKSRIFFGTLIFVSAVVCRADENKLEFHLDCASTDTNCIELQFESEPGKVIKVKGTPEMTVSQSDLSDAEMVKGEYGQDELQLRLKDESAKTFGQVTGNNIGRDLVVVANGKALIAPRIQSAITGGSLRITAGIGSGNKYLDSLPWLKKMSEDKKAQTERWNLMSMITYLVLGLLVIGGSIYMAFFRRKPKPESAS